ncbi:hypothetical protein GCM10010191_94850 [Actinomadura vinacea]|uniref:Ankyrin repeat domain-containing protein n=1 Tax=Actinomadura vinacea TaxID=115336 RepID=A0ABP5XM15_9ACTN
MTLPAAPPLPGRPPPHLAQELAGWRKARRYAVPQWMIEQATERRLAGNWAGACAAARVDVELDLADIARRHGTQVGSAVRDDLLHFAPDLLRWHLPRLEYGMSTIARRQAIVLGEYDGPKLYVSTPPRYDGPQRLRLRFGPKLGGDDDERFGLTPHFWAGLRHLWDARRSGELLERCGGDRRRAPFFHPDGTPVQEPGAGDDPAALFERVTLLQDRGEIEAAVDAAGLVMDPGEPDRPREHPMSPRGILSRLPLALSRMAPELRRLGGDLYKIRPGWGLPILIEARARPLFRPVRREEPGAAPLPQEVWRRLPDLDLLRAGRITPEELHPLVRSALFPGRPAPDGPVGPPDPRPPEPVRVRCRGEWHQIHSPDGELRLPHTDEEIRRESAMRVLGGATAGCFAVHNAWTGRGGRLPRALRALRQELFERVQHGDAPGVLRLLDAGADPRVRDGRKRTLLHALYTLDHEELLPRLLQAGLDLEARDQEGRTPLHLAVRDYGSTSLVVALLGAGARLDAVDDLGRPVALGPRNRRTLEKLIEERGLDPGTTSLG